MVGLQLVSLEIILQVVTFAKTVMVYRQHPGPVCYCRSLMAMHLVCVIPVTMVELHKGNLADTVNQQASAMIVP